LESTRRTFLAQSAGALGLLFLDSLTPQLIAQATQHARAAASGDPRAFRFLTQPEAADFDAFAARIIPSDDGTPGAREAGAVYFADYVLSAINPEQQQDFRGALKVLSQAATQAQPGASFASLPVEKQIAVMKSMDKQPTAGEANNSAGNKEAEAFGGLRTMVLMGTFSDPSLHGNRSKIGWNLIGYNDQAYWAPPFGYYDVHAEEKA